jgi:diketogulonate reductase-like aldo/keto reductase
MVTSSVPQRHFGRSLKKRHHTLPDTVPIVGLGCSSFSTFFWTNQDETDENHPEKHLFTADTLRKDHPIVQGWISTIHHAIIEHNINLLDTAPWYGHGTSEIVLGWALQELLTPESGSEQSKGLSSSSSSSPKIQREQLCVNTKVGRYEADPKHQFDFSRGTTLLSVQRSLQRLGGISIIKYIDVLQLHDPEFAPSLEILIEETIPALMECRSSGWCKALGLTGCKYKKKLVDHNEYILLWLWCVTIGCWCNLPQFVTPSLPTPSHWYQKKIRWKYNTKCFKQQYKNLVETKPRQFGINH